MHVIEPAPGTSHPVPQIHLQPYELGEDEQLTPRELEIVRLAAAGKNGTETASILEMSVWTVKHHWRNINLKMHCHTKAHVVAEAIRRGMIE